MSSGILVETMKLHPITEFAGPKENTPYLNLLDRLPVPPHSPRPAALRERVQNIGPTPAVSNQDYEQLLAAKTFAQQQDLFMTGDKAKRAFFANKICASWVADPSNKLYKDFLATYAAEVTTLNIDSLAGFEKCYYESAPGEFAQELLKTFLSLNKLEKISFKQTQSSCWTSFYRDFIEPSLPATLKELVFKQGRIPHFFTDSNIKTICDRCPQLEVLVLPQVNMCQTNQIFMNTGNLRKVDLSRGQINEENLTMLLEKNSNLCELKLQALPKMLNSRLMDILASHANLENLSLFCDNVTAESLSELNLPAKLSHIVLNAKLGPNFDSVEALSFNLTQRYPGLVINRMIHYA